MNFRTSKTLLIAVMALIVIALVLSASIAIAAKKAPAASRSGCPMMSTSAKAPSTCPMMSSKCSSTKLAGACGALTATVTSINHKDGTITLKVKPLGNGSSALKAAIGRLKVGDKVSVNATVGKDGRVTACPMR